MTVIPNAKRISPQRSRAEKLLRADFPEELFTVAIADMGCQI
jgi:hypothetical protein